MITDAIFENCRMEHVSAKAFCKVLELWESKGWAPLRMVVMSQDANGEWGLFMPDYVDPRLAYSLRGSFPDRAEALGFLGEMLDALEAGLEHYDGCDTCRYLRPKGGRSALIHVEGYQCCEGCAPLVAREVFDGDMPKKGLIQ